MSTASAITIRPATAEDIPVLLTLIRALARYENAEDKVEADEAMLRAEGFGERPAFEAIIAFLDDRPAGFALFFHNFSTWVGRRGLYVEDLFVEEWARGRRLGERLLAELARIAVARGCRRLDLSVLSWNPARAFYERIGLRHLDEWLPYRIEGEGLQVLAARSPATG
ncbi:MAG TPA: GNAT family N-acetyltransferase [Kiloniellales bacterium]|nr:GNAT family N-acetyltransferase [Kiloniellales bacterium]